MSTILDALKRLEQERPPDKAQQLPLSMHGGAAHPHRTRRRGAALILAILVTIGVVAALVWVNGGLPGKSFSRKSPRPAPIAETSPPEAATRPGSTVMRPGTRPEASAVTASAGLPATSPNPVTRERTQTPARGSRQTVPPVYSEQLRGGRPSAGSSADRADTAAQRPERTAATDQTVRTQVAPSPPRKPADPKKPASRDPYADADPLPRNTMRLQAISWSDSPGVRITVIDGRILREGHSVDGYTVIQIRPEDVIMGKEGKYWKLGYDLP